MMKTYLSVFLSHAVVVERLHEEQGDDRAEDGETYE